jgi:uncharacterized repeat protein (TIGR04076 family)
MSDAKKLELDEKGMRKESKEVKHYPQYKVIVRVVENKRGCPVPVGHEYVIDGVQIHGSISCVNAHASLYKKAYAMRYGVIFPETHDVKTGAIYVSCTEGAGWPEEGNEPVIFELRRGDLTPNPTMDRLMQDKNILAVWRERC